MSLQTTRRRVKGRTQGDREAPAALMGNGHLASRDAQVEADPHSVRHSTLRRAIHGQPAFFHSGEQESKFSGPSPDFFSETERQQLAMIHELEGDRHAGPPFQVTTPQKTGHKPGPKETIILRSRRSI